jgi:hypothetical protein
LFSKDENQPSPKRQKENSSNIIDNLNPSSATHQKVVKKHLRFMFKHHYDFYSERCGGEIPFPKSFEDIEYKHIAESLPSGG